MELRQMLKILWRWWWLVAIPVLVVGGYVGLTFQQPPTTYQVVMRFAAGGKVAVPVSPDYDRYHAWLSSEYIARGLANVAVTNVFAQGVAARLAEEGVDLPAAAIQGSIVSDYAESVLVIYLTWPDPAQIVAVADAITAEITQDAGSYFPQMAGIGTVARRLDDPAPVALPPSLRAQVSGPALRLLLAGGVGLGLAFLAHYLDPRVRERQEVEALGLNVVASIPRGR